MFLVSSLVVPTFSRSRIEHLHVEGDDVACRGVGGGVCEGKNENRLGNKKKKGPSGSVQFNGNVAAVKVVHLNGFFRGGYDSAVRAELNENENCHFHVISPEVLYPIKSSERFC